MRRLTRKIGHTIIDKLKATIEGLQNIIAQLEQKLSAKDSIRERMERNKIKKEDEYLKLENQSLRGVLAKHGISFKKKNLVRDSR